MLSNKHKQNLISDEAINKTQILNRLGVSMTLKYPHTLLLVDDEASILKSLQRLFRREGFDIITAGSGLEALRILSELTKPLSLIVSDQRMPEMNGSEFLGRAVELVPDAIRFILTGYADMDAIIDAVNKGKIHHYITKPWNDEELLGQVRNALAQVELRLENERLSALTERQNQELTELNKTLEKKVSERTWALQYQNKQLQKANSGLEKSFMDTTRLLVSLVESSNPKLGTYMKATSILAKELAKDAGLEESEQNKIEIAGLVHDIGLLGMPESMLEKDRKVMSPEELSAFKEHPIIAAMSLSTVDWMKEIGDIILAHHENIDGSGFPKRLSGDNIPIGSKILAIAADYQSMLLLWPENVQRMLGYARRYLDTDTVRSADISDENMREDIAAKIIERNAGHRYELPIVKLFLNRVASQRPYQGVLNLHYQALEVGMILMQDLRLSDGRLLLTRGTVLSDSTIHHIHSIGGRDLIDGPIEVAEPNPDAPDRQGES